MVSTMYWPDILPKPLSVYDVALLLCCCFTGSCFFLCFSGQYRVKEARMNTHTVE